VSSFFADTLHPVTRERKRAMWLDDYFGRRRYGVRFEGEDHVYRPEELPRDPEREQP
jgi:hypothetical protein